MKRVHIAAFVVALALVAQVAFAAESVPALKAAADSAVAAAVADPSDYTAISAACSQICTAT